MKLANCPFCGSGKEITEINHAALSDIELEYQVVCPNCDAAGPAKDTKKLAKQAWNSISVNKQEPKTFGFGKALKLMRKGKRVARKSEPEEIFYLKEGWLYVSGQTATGIFSDILAHDWTLVE